MPAEDEEDATTELEAEPMGGALDQGTPLAPPGLMTAARAAAVVG